MTATANPARPAKLPREQDPRNPVHRLTALLDEGTLELITPDDESGMLAAVGRVHGTTVVAFCSDATVMGGAMGDVGCRVVVDAYHRAITDGVPIIGLWHSGGARLAEGVLSLHAVGRIFQVMTQASGVIPQVSVVLGPAAGGAAYLQGLMVAFKDRPRQIVVVLLTPFTEVAVTVLSGVMMTMTTMSSTPAMRASDSFLPPQLPHFLVTQPVIYNLLQTNQHTPLAFLC